MWKALGITVALGLGTAGPGTVVASATEPPEVRQLPPVEVSWSIPLAPGEIHVYEADLAAEDFLWVELEQTDLDVTAALADPDGKTVFEVDHPFGQRAPESVAWVAEVAGAYRLAVRAYSPSAEAGDYNLTVRARRRAGEADRRWAEAELGTTRAHALADRHPAEDPRAVVAAYAEARELWRQLGRGDREARILLRSGQILRRHGDFDGALDLLQEALALERRLEHPAGIAAVLGELGTVHRRRGENPRAHEVYAEALDLWRKLGDDDRSARVHSSIGHTLQAMGELRPAAEHYASAIALFEAGGDRLRQAAALASLGPLRTRLGEPDRAVSDYERALELLRGLDRADVEADVLNNLGITLDQLGEPREALDAFEAALRVYRRLGDDRRIAAIENSRGRLLVDLGAPREGRELLLDALELLQSHGDPYLENRVLLNLGAAERDLDDAPSALERFDRALDGARRSADRGGEALAVYHRADLLYRTGRHREAREAALHSLELLRGLEDVEGETRALHVFGRSAAALGLTEAATRAFRQVVELAEAADDRVQQARGRRELGRLELDRGRLDEAAGHLEAALDDYESLRARISGAGLRKSHFADVRDTYDLLIHTFMRRHREHPDGGWDLRAFAAAERSRARGLLDVLDRAASDQDGDPALRRREKELRRRLNALAQRRDDPHISREIRSLLAEYRLVEARLSPLAEEEVRGFSSSAHSEKEPREKEPRVEAFGAELLGGDDVLLEFALAEPRSYLWVFTRGGRESFELPGRATIEQAAMRVHRRLARTDDDRSEQRRALRELSDLVLGPVHGRSLPARWVLVLDGALWYVPFAALPVPRQGSAEGTVPLIADHEVVQVPSLAAWRRLRERSRTRPSKRLAVIADPVYGLDDPRRAGGEITPKRTPGEEHVDIPGLPAPTVPRSGDGPLPRLVWSGREARDIAALAGPGPGLLTALGAEASRDLLLDPELASYAVVHLAVHGVLDTDHPELSGLALSRDDDGDARDSFLRLHDVYGLRWRSDLVVLSGCRTALGKNVRGEGLVGLAHGFLHAGASQVAASLWSIDDRAGAELMTAFYDALLVQDLSPAASLRRAQLDLWRSRGRSDPYFWAPFVLIGDPRAEGPR